MSKKSSHSQNKNMGKQSSLSANFAANDLQQSTIAGIMRWRTCKCSRFLAKSAENLSYVNINLQNTNLSIPTNLDSSAKFAANELHQTMASSITKWRIRKSDHSHANIVENRLCGNVNLRYTFLPIPRNLHSSANFAANCFHQSIFSRSTRRLTQKSARSYAQNVESRSRKNANLQNTKKSTLKKKVDLSANFAANSSPQSRVSRITKHITQKNTHSHARNAENLLYGSTDLRSTNVFTVISIY